MNSIGDVLNLIEANNGIKIIEGNIVKKQNHNKDTLEGFEYKKHVSEKMLKLYLAEKKKESISKVMQIKQDYQVLMKKNSGIKNFK